MKILQVNLPLLFILIVGLSIVKADDEGWSIEGCLVSDKVEEGKPVQVTVKLTYNGTEPSQKKKFDFAISLKDSDGEVSKVNVSKEVESLKPNESIELKLKGPKMKDTGTYTVLVENEVATLAVKQIVLE